MMVNVGRMVQFVSKHRLPMILVSAFLIRLINSSTRGLQYDDVFSIFLAQRSLTEIIKGTAADTMPPLYYFLLHFWMLPGQSVWFIRLLSIFLSVLAVFLAFLTIKRLSNSRAAAWTALLMAISPFQYYHAQDVRNYALLLCAELGYVLFFSRLLRPGTGPDVKRRWDWIGLVLCGAAAMYTHNAAIFAIVLPDIYLLVTRRWRFLRSLVLSQVCIALLALPWLLLVPGQVAKVQFAWWQNPPGIVDILQIPLVWSAGLPLNGVWLAVGFLVAFEILALIVLETLRWRSEAKEIGLLYGVIVFLPLMMFVISYLMRPIFVPRGFILAGAAYLGVGGWVIGKTWKHGAGKLLLGGFVLAAAIGLPAQARFNGFPRSPFEEASRYLSGTLLEDELVVHDNKLSYFPFAFYQPELMQVFIADPPGSGNDTFARGSQEAMSIFPAADIRGAVDNCSRVTFVVFSRAVEEYRELGETDHPALVFLRERYRETNHKVFNDMEVYQFAEP